ncbi:MAG: carboxypeptidase-like regulatory domain-containing protein [Bacteroidota bacterium]
MNLLFLVVCLAPASLAQNAGILAGTVTYAETGETLVGANVFLPEIQRGAATDIDGRYIIRGIPAGTYTVQFFFAGLETQEIVDVEVSSGRTRMLDTALEPILYWDSCRLACCYEPPIITMDMYSVKRVYYADYGDCCSPTYGTISGSYYPTER